ncbi:ABC transporter ATP-binding protein [Aquabacterium sp. J223]|uniref:ABC transporter ATP-binding protein n=1 Tax=Aquabacterium sp. J223 TaxID=2898431 RepID=UPI0021AD7AFB|nr:ABC transporter ATP-binding protein [Aquabacterium sp. J223]UUX94509.1 ABC transporter ATP-binding protein [Aquabacterium sp. J223]
MTAPLLEAEGLVAGYGETVVLDGVGFSVNAGDCLAVLGRNGVGKTTLLATLMGLTTRHGGRLRLEGDDITHRPVHWRARHGLGYVPQEREIFRSLTVLENLAVAVQPGGWSVERVLDLFPGLRQRTANTGNRLSGGEQQMLAVARALVGGPRVLLLDEPMEGLAPIIVEGLFDALRQVRADGGMAIVLVEQKAELALAFADEVMVLDRGRVVHRGPSAPLRGDAQAQARLLGIGDERLATAG